MNNTDFYLQDVFKEDLFDAGVDEFEEELTLTYLQLALEDNKDHICDIIKKELVKLAMVEAKEDYKQYDNETDLLLTKIVIDSLQRIEGYYDL